MIVISKEVGAGWHPNQVMLEIETTSKGKEYVSVERGSLVGGGLRVSVVGERGNEILVELPRESESGAWRIWVDRSKLKSEAEAA